MASTPSLSCLCANATPIITSPWSNVLPNGIFYAHYLRHFSLLHAYCSRNCQSIKRNIIPQIRLSSFRRISPHFASALHINNSSFFFFLFFLHTTVLHSPATAFSTYRFRGLLNFPSIFHLFIFSIFFPIIHATHPLERLRTSYPNPLYPLGYGTSFNVHKSLLIPRYSLPHVESLLHSFFFIRRVV